MAEHMLVLAFKEMVGQPCNIHNRQCQTHGDMILRLTGLLLALLLLIQLGAAKTLRAMIVYVMSLATLTMNLPPVIAAPRLWEGLAVTLG
jgi:hypothetical protein